jgi:hypothetical protein
MAKELGKGAKLLRKLVVNTAFEKNRISSEKEKIEKRIDDWVELSEKTLIFTTYDKYWFDNGDYETKTNILRVLGQNFEFKDGKLTITLRKSY